MDDCKKPETLTLSDFAARYVDPLAVKAVIDPAFTAWAKGGENKPMTRAERVRFEIRNKCYEWRARLALWIAPWLAEEE